MRINAKQIWVTSLLLHLVHAQCIAHGAGLCDTAWLMRVRIYDHNRERIPLTEAQKRMFRGVGKLECDLGGNQGYPSGAYVIGDELTVVTSAHGFMDPRTKALVDYGKCHFVIYHSRTDIERIPMVRVKSRWVDDNAIDDPNKDVALVRLARPPRKGAELYPVETGQNEPGPIVIVGFHEDLGDGRQLYISFGNVYEKSGALAHEKYSNIAVHDAPTTGSTSASPMFGPSGAIIGLHSGYFRGFGVLDPKQFDSMMNFNTGFIFDERFRDELDEFTAL